MENIETMNRTIQVVPALRMMFSDKKLMTLRVVNTELTRMLSDDKSFQENLLNVNIMRDRVDISQMLLLVDDDNVENILKSVKQKLDKSSTPPSILLIKGVGIVVVGTSAKHCSLLVELFELMLTVIGVDKVISNKALKEYEIIEKARELLVGSILVEEKNDTSSVAHNKTIIVTGAAQGFGEGIARNLILKGANIVVADLNEEVGIKTVDHLNTLAKNNCAIFVKTDVSDINSINNLVESTVSYFGSIDTFISNAGVLRAGGLDDMGIEDFDFVTKINYNSYFYCTKVVSKVMKLQTKYATPDYYADVIQINSKSGLRGSKANFAYAGGKFGGIGLTQSFALELAPYRIKVNSICPGNYYEGPLWSDPENGLFTQYLKAGKVPGARTIEDVKEFYLAQVPMNKGCTPEDVVKAVLYLMDQCSETGQALPISGGQVMMS